MKIIWKGIVRGHCSPLLYTWEWFHVTKSVDIPMSPGMRQCVPAVDITLRPTSWARLYIRGGLRTKRRTISGTSSDLWHLTVRCRWWQVWGSHTDKNERSTSSGLGWELGDPVPSTYPLSNRGQWAWGGWLWPIIWMGCVASRIVTNRFIHPNKPVFFIFWYLISTFLVRTLFSAIRQAGRVV